MTSLIYYSQNIKVDFMMFVNKFVIIVVDVVVDWLVLAASLEVVGPPGLLLAEALDVLGPMVLLLDIDQQ